jgi:hypothetical protein
MENANVPIPITNIINIPSMKRKFEKLLKVQSEPVDPPIMLQDNHFRPQYDEHPPLFISLQLKNKRLNNCMLDSGADENIMTLKVMTKLGLEVSKPYRNVRDIEPRAIPTHGVIENVKVCIDQYPKIFFLMDIMVINVPDVWGMVLSRKFAAMLADNL